ncbi:MAG: alpha/beta hydrolase [Burkholderiales bacterium]|jgi:pimeloyl-ACP methyl ester carboxylesterase
MSNLKLNLVDQGRGDPAIVFIHGFTCNLSSWNEQLSALSDSYRCVAVDLPGHGASARPREATIESLARAVNDTLEALKLNEAVLVGHSMGCRLVSEIYSQSPARVRGLVHIDGSAVAAGDADDAVRKMTETLDRIGMDAFIEELYKGFYVDSTPAEIRDFVNAGIPAIKVDFARELWLNLVRWDASRSRALLASIGVPLLAIQTTFLDANLKRVSLAPGQTTPWLDEIRNAVNDLTIAIVPGVGHFPMLEAPRQTNDAITKFVRRLT